MAHLHIPGITGTDKVEAQHWFPSTKQDTFALSVRLKTFSDGMEGTERLSLAFSGPAQLKYFAAQIQAATEGV